MGKRTVRFLALALAFVIAAVPVTGSAAWDRLLQDSEDSAGGGSSSASSLYPHSTMKSRIKEAKAVNSDVVGWITVPNTNISTPVPRHSSDNSHYMYRDWQGTHYPNITYKNYVETANYMDYRSQIGSGWRNGTSRNLVIYGHNWINLRPPYKIGNVSGYTMFEQLMSYTSIEFTRANPHIYFSTDELEGVWRVFAVAHCEISEKFFYNNPNPSDEDYAKLLGEWKARSLYNFGVDVDTTDRIITLSTCTRAYGNVSEGGVGDNQRFVVVARLLRAGETENDSVSVSVNANMKQPQW